MNPTLPDHREILVALRASLSQGERPLCGLDQIAAWFVCMRFLVRGGRPPSPGTLRRWRREEGLPVARMPDKGRLWTTNYLLCCWLLRRFPPLGQGSAAFKP